MSGAINKYNGSNTLYFSSVSTLERIWLIGLLVGIVFTSFGIERCDTLLPDILQCCFGSPKRILLGVLPFLLSATAVHLSHPRWLYWICGIKAVWFATCCFLFCYYYRQAGWLACLLFMFFDVSSLPFLFFYWLRNLSGYRSRKSDKCIMFLSILSLIFIDYRIIIPYASKFGFF